MSIKYFDSIRPKVKKRPKRWFSYILVGIILFSLFAPMYKTIKKNVSGIKTAKANYQYTASAGQINSAKGTQRYNNYYQTRTIDISTWTVSPIDIVGADTSLDMEVTIGGVQQQGANKMIATFATYASNVSLHYVFSIYDATDSIWRPLNNHTAFDPLSPGDLTNFYSQELVPAAINTRYTYQFEIFDGYFADTTTPPGTAITTELSHFINGSNEVKLRVSSNDDPDANVWFLGWDFAQLEVAVDSGYAPSSATVNTGTVGARYYSDTFTSDYADAVAGTTNSFAITDSGLAVDAEFRFDDIKPPDASANTILIWYEGATSKINLAGSLKLYMWNYTTGAWEVTSITSGNGSSTVINTNRILMFSTPLTDHISAAGATREAKIKVVASHGSTFNLYVDWLKLVVGSTNDGSQQNNVSVGGAPVGSLSNTGNVDTTAAVPANWTIPAATTPYPNQFYGDTSATAANYHVATDFSVPMTKPANANITGMQFASRVNMDTAAAIRVNLGIRDYANGWSDTAAAVGGAVATYYQIPWMVSGSVYRYPVWGSFGTATAATTASDVAFGSNPQDYHDSTNNFAGFKIRTTVGNAATWNLNVDFAFLSYRYVESAAQLTTQFTPETAVVNTVGAVETNNWRFTKANDGQFWTVANIGAGAGVDVELEFQGVTKPTTWNRLIVNTKLAWSTISPTFNIQIYDWTGGGTWYPLGGHGQSPADYLLVGSATASTQQFYQFEIFDGYFRDAGTATPGAAISTPVSNFIGTGGDLGKVKLKIVRGAITSNLIMDWAQIEVAQDNTYYAKSASFNGTGATPARFYNDTYYPDNAVATASTNLTYSMRVTKANNAGVYLNTQLNFEDVVTPYTGANAILVDTQFATSQANPVLSIQLYNYTLAQWDLTPPLMPAP